MEFADTFQQCQFFVNCIFCFLSYYWLLSFPPFLHFSVQCHPTAQSNQSWHLTQLDSISNLCTSYPILYVYLIVTLHPTRTTHHPATCCLLVPASCQQQDKSLLLRLASLAQRGQPVPFYDSPQDHPRRGLSITDLISSFPCPHTLQST